MTNTSPPAFRILDRSADLAAAVYRLASLLPPLERRAMGDQLRRAAVSIVCNIAEGNGRASTKEYLHHLAYARGSLREVEALLLVCSAIGYATPEAIGAARGLADETGRMLTRLIAVLRDRDGRETAGGPTGTGRRGPVDL